MDCEAAQTAWDRWIREYWDERLTGAPRPFSGDEAREMINWALALEPVFPEAVDRACQATPSFEDTLMLFHELKDHELVSRHPTAFASLTGHILRGLDQLEYEQQYAQELTKDLINAGADTEVALGLCEELARLGCPRATDIRRTIDEEE
jgi:hypothetical protein